MQTKRDVIWVEINSTYTMQYEVKATGEKGVAVGTFRKSQTRIDSTNPTTK